MTPQRSHGTRKHGGTWDPEHGLHAAVSFQNVALAPVAQRDFAALLLPSSFLRRRWLRCPAFTWLDYFRLFSLEGYGGWAAALPLRYDSAGAGDHL